MSHRSNKRRGSSTKLDEFPEDFDDTFFHNELVDSNRKIPILRNLVYRKIKDCITSRVESYGSNVPLSDKFDVDFPTEGYSDFEWAVIREEIMSLGIDSTSEFKDEKLFALQFHIEREISLTMTMKEMEHQHQIYQDGDVSSESEDDGETGGETE